MDANLVNPFIEATVSTLETTAQVQVKALKPYLKKEQGATGDITGVMEMTGDFSGSISISFSEKGILDIVSTMFGEEMTELNDEIKDAVGEIANMISGQVTNKLGEMGNSLKVSLAEVVMGPGQPIAHLEDKPVVALPFKTRAGKFTIEICFERQQGD